MSRHGRNRVLRRAAFKSGLWGERLACAFLTFKGYHILVHRFRCPVGEIDLIAQRGKTIVFVEVKYRASEAIALESLRPRQRQRIIKAAKYWLSRRRGIGGFDHRFDLVVMDSRFRLRHIQNAFCETELHDTTV
ncbi:MAG: YraN family protein [Hyphomicrobiales bacterium]